MGVGLVEIDVARLEGEAAADGHGVARVDDQIHDHLLEVPWICLYLVQGSGRDRAEFDALADQPANEPTHSSSPVEAALRTG